MVSVGKFLRERLALDGPPHMLPGHMKQPLFLTGPAIILMILVQGVLGMLLIQFYHPAYSAYPSVVSIVEDTKYGAFYRNLHYWIANIIILTLVLHLLKNSLIGAFGRPREVQWTIGIALGLVVVSFYLTGIVIKQDQEAYVTYANNSGAIEALTSVDYIISGGVVKRLPPMSRIFLVHAALLPILGLLLLVGHVQLARRFGPTVQSWVEESARTLRLSRYLLLVVAFVLIAVAASAALSQLFPAPLGGQAEWGTPVGRPVWVSLWTYALEGLIGGVGTGLGWFIVISLLLAAPVIAATTGKAPRRIGLTIFGIILILWAVLTVLSQVR